jgi:ElaA protein
MHWVLKKFELLTPFELYDIIKLRNEVFVVEQNCVFQDADGKDIHCHHLMGYLDKELVVYTRLVPPGISYPVHSSIGRVVSSKKVRGGGYGKLLMEKSIEIAERLFGPAPIKIGAQLYLNTFYTSLGFVNAGEIYLEDGIEHIEMIRQPDAQ